MCCEKSPSQEFLMYGQTAQGVCPDWCLGMFFDDAATVGKQ